MLRQSFHSINNTDIRKVDGGKEGGRGEKRYLKSIELNVPSNKFSQAFQ